MPIRLVPALVGAALLVGCSSPQPVPSPSPVPEASPARTLQTLVAESDDLSVLATLIDAAGLTSALANDGPFTLFAPSNEAFASLPAGTIETWLQPERRDELARRLSQHLVPVALASSDLRNGQALRPLTGERLRVRTFNEHLLIDGAAITQFDIGSSNGVLHVIDTVLAD